MQIVIPHLSCLLDRFPQFAMVSVALRGLCWVHPGKRVASGLRRAIKETESMIIKWFGNHPIVVISFVVSIALCIIAAMAFGYSLAWLPPLLGRLFSALGW